MTDTGGAAVDVGGAGTDQESQTGVDADLSALWMAIADNYLQGYSPLYERLARFIAGDHQILALILQEPPPSHHPALLLAAVRYLLLETPEHPLAAVYDGTSDRDPGPLFKAFVVENRERLFQLMAVRHVQRNEVGRSALIGPALAWVAEHSGEPIQLVEVGCSAGLNLLIDHFRLNYGPCGATGSSTSSVTVNCEVRAGRPPIQSTLPPIAGRFGIDRDPPNLLDPDDARWVLACVWPDTDQSARLAAAVRLGQQLPPPVRRGDAGRDLRVALEEVGPGVLTVVTAWTFSRLNPDERDRFLTVLADISAWRPLVWMAADNRGVVPFLESSGLGGSDRYDSGVLSVSMFDKGNVSSEILALVHVYGSWIDWRGGGDH
jgi:hypothetical protein